LLIFMRDLSDDGEKKNKEMISWNTNQTKKL
jgi:hypothetical protein